jgi:hypothetical protein
MNPGELARPRLLLRWRSRKKIILNSFDRKQLCVVKITDHAVVLEILEQKRQPFRGVGAHAKIDDAIIDL